MCINCLLMYKAKELNILFISKKNLKIFISDIQEEEWNHIY